MCKLIMTFVVGETHMSSPRDQCLVNGQQPRSQQNSIRATSKLVRLISYGISSPFYGVMKLELTINTLRVLFADEELCIQ